MSNFIKFCNFQKNYLKKTAIEGLGDVGITIPLGVAGDDHISMETFLTAQLTGLLPSC